MPADIPITITNQPVDNCITPKHQVEKSIPRRGRPRKSPERLAIPVITVQSIGEKENTCGNSPIPKTKPSIVENVVKQKRTSVRNVRRKILTEESDEPLLTVDSGKAVRKSTRLSSRKNNDSTDR